MQDEVISRINEILKKEKMTRKSLYENLLAEGVVKPNSEKLVGELLEYSINSGLINSSRIIKFKKRKGRLPEIFTIEQLIKLFDEVDRPKLAICMWLGFFCGLRIREVCNLEIDDIDLKNKLIFVRNSKNTNRSKEGYGKDRIVTVPDLAINPITKWLEIIEGGKWFIPSMQDVNKPIRTKTIHEQYRYLMNRCNLSKEDYTTEYRAKNHGKRKDMKKTTYKLRFHTLRHTYASYLLDKGVPLENIQRALGHNQIDTTLIYAKVRDTKTKQFINNAFNMPMKWGNNHSQLNNYQVEKPEPKKQDFNINAEEILKQRLARGEIDLVTYKRLMAEINPENTVNVIFQTKEKNN